VVETRDFAGASTPYLDTEHGNENEQRNRLGDFAFCPAFAEMLRTRRAIGENGRVFDGLAALSTNNNLLALRSLMK
jgi:hypothetical protein